MLDDRAIQGLIGRSLGGYRLVLFVGVRTFGHTFEGVAEATGQPVVVSVAYAGAADGLAGRRIEFGALAGPRHPNIAPTLAAGTEGDFAYVVQPWVAGETLAERLRRGLPADLAARGAAVAEIVPQIGSALVYAHAFSIAHGALSPDAIIVTPDGQALLTDFVRAAPDAAAQFPPGYLAPERRVGAGAPEPAADQYALAAVTHAMMTGHPPAPTGGDDDPPPAVAAVLRKALSADPAARYDGVATFLGQLLLALDTLPAVAGPAPPAMVAPPGMSAAAPPAGRARSSSRAVGAVGAAIAAIAAVTLLAVVGPLTWRALNGARQAGPAAPPPTTAPTSAPTTVPTTVAAAPTPPPLTPTAAPIRAAAPTATPAPPSPTAAAATAPPSTPSPAVGRFGGEWFHNFGQMQLTQTGARLSGTFTNAFTLAGGSIEGDIAGNTFTGRWTSGAAGGPIEWRLSPDHQTFDGFFRDGAENRWCGARPDVAFPDGCSFAGAWINRVIDRADCPMTLRRVNLTVAGIYCNGSISGAITFAPGAPLTVLDGSWNVAGFPPGPFRLYLLGYDGRQFQGNWMGDGPNQWCGWRAGAPEPSPCLRN
jgi:serine/threonine-protein kinase